MINPTLDPRDVLSMIMAMAFAWSPASLSYTATHGDPAEDIARRRATLAEMVRNALSR